ncbi:MAG: hypothetical protein QM594_03835 [Niabella sp.]
MEIKQFFLPVILFMLMACGNAEYEQSQEQVHETVTSAVQEGPSEVVTLDNGKKWSANKETTEGIEKMKTILQKGIAEHKAPSELLPGLQQEFKTIFDKCTMTGEAHNQLHHFLIPLKNQLDGLKSDSASAKEMEALQEYLDTYSQYFE